MRALCAECREKRTAPELRQDLRRDPAGEENAAAGEDRERMVARRRAEALEEEVQGRAGDRVRADAISSGERASPRPSRRKSWIRTSPGPETTCSTRTRPSSA